MYLTQPLRGPHADCMDPNVQKGLLTLQPNHSGIASSHCIYIMPRDQKFHQPDCLCKIYSGQHYEKRQSGMIGLCLRRTPPHTKGQ